jgi:hypothetical protein
VSAPHIRAGQVAARLSGAGLTPHMTDYENHTRVEAELPDAVTVETWREVLAAMEEGDRFGLVTSANRRSVWAAFDR